jgi:hypothetical protein
LTDLQVTIYLEITIAEPRLAPATLSLEALSMNAMRTTTQQRVKDTPISVGGVVDCAPRADGPGDGQKT